MLGKSQIQIKSDRVTFSHFKHAAKSRDLSTTADCELYLT